MASHAGATKDQLKQPLLDTPAAEVEQERSSDTASDGERGGAVRWDDIQGVRPKQALNDANERGFRACLTVLSAIGNRNIAVIKNTKSVLRVQLFQGICYSKTKEFEGIQSFTSGMLGNTYKTICEIRTYQPTRENEFKTMEAGKFAATSRLQQGRKHYNPHKENSWVRTQDGYFDPIKDFLVKGEVTFEPVKENDFRLSMKANSDTTKSWATQNTTTAGAKEPQSKTRTSPSAAAQSSVSPGPPEPPAMGSRSYQYQPRMENRFLKSKIGNYDPVTGIWLNLTAEYEPRAENNWLKSKKGKQPEADYDPNIEWYDCVFQKPQERPVVKSCPAH